MKRAIGSTIALVLALAAAGAGAGCGASQAEIRAAQSSGYDADFAIVYTQALAAVSALYPHLDENASAGAIRTAWHPIKYSEGQSDPQSQQTRDVASTTPGVGGQPAGTNVMVKRFFIRFTVNVVGGNPWRVRVVGQASEWEAGAVPTELKGGDEPHWLKGRTEALQVAIYRRLKQYAVNIKVADDDEVEQAAAVDLSAVADLPGDAGQVVGAVLAAAKARDGAAIRGHMTDGFSWSLGADPSADVAIAMWQADPAVYAALVQTLEAGCVADGDVVTCPREYATNPGFSGYRAGFRRGADGLWKMAFFVRGQ